MWTCPKCGTKVDPSFEVCWQCGTSQDGVEDPAFVSADDAPPIEEPPVTSEFLAESSAAHNLPPVVPVDMVECCAASSLAEARFIADQLMGQGIPAVAREMSFSEQLRFATLTQAHAFVSASDLRRAQEYIEAHELPRRAREAHGATGDDLVACYLARDLMEARFLADQLSSQDIPAMPDNEDMHAELGSMSSTPRVWVRARDYTLAREWLEQYDAQQKAHVAGQS